MRLSIAYVRAQVLDNTFSHLLSIVIIFLGLFIPSRKEEKLCPRLVTILQGADCLCVPKVSCWYCSISSSTNSTKQILYRRGKGIQDLKKKKKKLMLAKSHSIVIKIHTHVSQTPEPSWDCVCWPSCLCAAGLKVIPLHGKQPATLPQPRALSPTQINGYLTIRASTCVPATLLNIACVSTHFLTTSFCNKYY